MNIDIHKDFKYKNKDDLKKKAISRAREYLATRYEMTDDLRKHLDDTEVWFTNGHGGWYRSERRQVKVGIGRDKWYTYKRKTVGKMSRGISVPQLLCVTIILLHELTHAVQHFEGRKYSEVETTENEIEYVGMVSPSTLGRMEEVPDDLWDRYRKPNRRTKQPA